MRYANGVGLLDILGRLTPFAVPVIFCTDFLHRFSAPTVDPGVCGVGDLHAVKHLRYTESLPCLNGTAASRYVEENFQRTVGFLIKA